MENLKESRYRYYQLYLAGINGRAEITVEGGKGRIMVETGKIPATVLPFGQGYPTVWLVNNTSVFFVGIMEVTAGGCATVERSFYPFNVGGTGQNIEDFNELLVTVEKVRQPLHPGKTVLFRQVAGCFAGRVPPANPWFYELQPFDPPMPNYRWWGIVGNLCIAEPEPVCREKYRKEGIN